MAMTAAVAVRLRGRMATDPRLPLAAARDRLLRRLPPPPEPDPLATSQRGPGSRTQRERQRDYLEATRNIDGVWLAARAAGVSREIVYHWRRTDPAFVMREQLARADYDDGLRWQIHVRAFAGSDALLLMMVKALLPEYRKTVPRTEPVAADDGLPRRFTLALAAPTPNEAPTTPQEARGL